MSRHGFKKYSLAVPVLLAFLAQGQQALAEENKTAEAVPTESTVATNAVETVVAVEEKVVEQPTQTESAVQASQTAEISLSPAVQANTSERVAQATDTTVVAQDQAPSVVPSSSVATPTEEATTTGTSGFFRRVATPATQPTTPAATAPVTTTQSAQQPAPGTSASVATTKPATPVATSSAPQTQAQTVATKTADAQASKPAEEAPIAKDTLTITNVDEKAGTFDVLVSNVSNPATISKVLVPVWSDLNSQDDIKWYEAAKQGNGNYLVNVSAGNHKGDAGIYHANLYYVHKNGEQKPVAGTTVDLKLEDKVKTNEPSAQVRIVNQNNQTGTFDVLVSNIVAPKGLRQVSVPVWSEKNGQDDLKWYAADKQIDGSYKVSVNISNHKNSRGQYNAHVYFVQGDGSQQGIAAVKTEVTEVKPTGTINIVNKTDKDGSFDVVITNVSSPNGLKRVAVPVWSDANGQDDIKWYSADKQTDGSYLVNVKISDHHNSAGVYHAHLYYEQGDGSLTGIGATKTTVATAKTAETKGTITIVNKTGKAAGFDVIITDVSSPNGLKRVAVPVWSQANGQDDLKWYDADKQSDGSYKVSVSAANHKNSKGVYNVNLYYELGNGSLRGVTGTQTTLNFETAKPSGTITVTNKNDKNGSFDVVITNVSSPDGLKRVAVPVWSQANGQDDLKWYDARLQSNGSYIVNVHAANHKNSSGVYNAHLYYELPDGNMVGIGGTTTTLNYQKTRSKVIFIDPGHGGKDPGAYYGGTAEKTLALDVSNMLKRKLEASGYQVVMSRTGDQHVDFVTERSRLANNSNADIFVSIHFNASGAGTTKANGIETYWYEADKDYPSRINQAMHNNAVRLAESESLARAVQTNLVSTTGATNRGVKRNTFAVLRETSKPAILVELGYMDNPSELAKIKQRSYQEKLAEGLAKGILSWYGTVGATAVAVPAQGSSGFRSASVTATTGGTSQLKNLNGQQKQFLDAVYPSVKSASKSSGLLPSVMTAQAILESGWGQSRLASSPNNNLYGIKAGDGWSGSTTSVLTKEFVNGRYIDTSASFRTYRNWSESIANYASFFTSTPWRTQRYANYRAAKTYQTALPALQASGYATDPSYAAKLKDIIERYNLQAWDS